MPDKHEVGGSSPLGPTIKVKDKAKVESRIKRPRAFVEREQTRKGMEKQEGRDEEPRGER